MLKLVRNCLAVGIIATSWCAMSSAAQASVFGFVDLDGSDGGTAIDQQMWVDVVDSGSNTVEFQFYNIGSIDATVTLISWDQSLNPALAPGGTPTDASLLSGDPVLSYIAPPAESDAPHDPPPWLSFSVDNTKNLPQDPVAAKGGVFDEDFGVVANDPLSKDGLDPGEILGVRFDLVAGTTYQDILNALVNTNYALNPGDPHLRIGLHVQSIGAGCTEELDCSDTLLNNPVDSGNQNPVVPLPAAGFLLLTALGGLGCFRRFRRVVS